jgi:hypothetical protein
MRAVNMTSGVDERQIVPDEGRCDREYAVRADEVSGSTDVVTLIALLKESHLTLLL